MRSGHADPVGFCRPRSLFDAHAYQQRTGYAIDSAVLAGLVLEERCVGNVLKFSVSSGALPAAIRAAASQDAIL
jgi:hypothetical protein